MYDLWFSFIMYVCLLKLYLLIVLVFQIKNKHSSRYSNHNKMWIPLKTDKDWSFLVAAALGHRISMTSNQDDHLRICFLYDVRFSASVFSYISVISVVIIHDWSWQGEKKILNKTSYLIQQSGFYIILPMISSKC